jgi:hypothetical protein
MKLWQIAATVAVGVMYSGSGAIQVNAALYTFSVDFETKTVADFDDFTQTYYSTTYDLGGTITYNFAGTYNFDNNLPFSVNMIYEGYWKLNGTGSNLDYQNVNLPDFLVTSTLTTYSAVVVSPASDQLIAAIINDDANYAQFISSVAILQSGMTNGLKLRLYNWTNYITITYNFDTTYLFNFILSDTQASTVSTTGSWSIGSEQTIKVDYVYTTAGNDEYRIVNTNIGSVGTARKKYAVDYNDEYFRGESVGARVRHAYNTDAPYTYDQLTMAASGIAFINTKYSYYYLNSSNKEQDISNVPEFEFEYEDCGSFLALNVPCFINNGLAYVVNDAPVISDAFTLLNAGMKLGGQAFSIIGQFSDNNLFGVLILGGLGITAVRWFLKQD